MPDEVTPQQPEGSLSVTRRSLLGGAGLVAAALAIPGTADAALRAITSRAGSLTFSVRDRESMQRLTLSFAHARISGGRIVADGRSPASMVVDFGPQALIEQITSGAGPVTPVDARLAQSSRLAFTLPSGGLPATRTGLLTWLECEPRVTSLGAYPAGERIPPADVVYRNPSAVQTAIEMPWFMILSPSDESGWEHALTGATRDGRTEVWQTRLATRTFDDTGAPTGYDHSSDTVRVVWLRDRQAARMLGTTPAGIVRTTGADDYPFEMRPNPQDRSDIGRLTGMTSNAAGSAALRGGVAEPVEVDLALSALGGTMRASGEWNEPGVSSLTSWQQRTWDGRDTYIRTTRTGFVYPFAAPATLVEEVTREFLADRSGTVRAFERLSQRVIINVPSIDLDAANGMPHAGRGAPFSRVIFRTRATPPITGVATPLSGEWRGVTVFVPEIPGGEPFAFTVTGRDRAGRSITFDTPMLFAEDKLVSLKPSGSARANFTKTGSRALRTYFNGLPETKRRANMRGVYVAFAPDGGADGSTSMPTASLDWHLEIGTPRGSSSDLARERRPYSFPRMDRATINVDGVSAMAGDAQSVDVSFPDVYLSGGIGGTELGIYLEGIGSQDVGAGAQRGGGISAPSMGVAGIGSITGVLPGSPGDLPSLSVAAPKINPARMLQGFTLFGGISLADLLPDPIDMLQKDPSTGAWRPNPKAPAFATDRSFDIDLPDIPTEVFVRYEWRPELKDFPPLLPSAGDADFFILVEAKASALEFDAYWKAEGALTNLRIDFFGRKVFAYVILERIGFTAGSGRASDMQVEIGDVVFGDALAFLSTMSRFLSFGSGNGPILDIDADSITTGFSLAVPEIGLGAVTLSGLATRVAINLPFGRDPVRFELGFSSPSDPFAVTVMGIGGGGWFGLDVGLDGVEYLNIGALIKAALELDLGVAAGGVSASFGLQYEISGVGRDTEMSLTAFLCIKGRVEVLGIVTIGIELCIGFTFPIPDPGERFKLIGQATCTVKVKVCGIKKSVRITVRRTVTGGVMPEVPSTRSARSAIGPAADVITPITFGDVMTQTDWSEWCGAFA